VQSLEPVQEQVECELEPELVAAAERAQVVFDAIMRPALELGGTITGEHGVGLLTRTWLREELGARSYALQQSIKSVFDPHGILNPGKML
jgi:glycolate oxidase